MITESADYCPARIAPVPGARSIIASPNQSADWHTNKQLLLVVGLLSGTIATGFSLIGAWIVLPFAGLEMTALGSALYVVCRKSSQRHILHFAGEHLVIEKGMRCPQQVWQLPLRDTFISVERRRHPWDPLRLTLCCDRDGRHESIPVGEFLNRDDSTRLLTLLRQQGLAVRNDSTLIQTTV